MAHELDGQVAMVTGGGSGLGAAFARRLAADGAHVVVADIDPRSAAAVADEVGGSNAAFDVGDSAAFDTAVDHAVATLGRLDIMINNAGIAPPLDEQRLERAMSNQLLRIEGRVAEMAPAEVLTSLSDDEWERMLRVHLSGTFHGTRSALRHMQVARRGAIVNMASILGRFPSPGAPHYSVAKAGIIALTKSAALETAHLGIRINAVCPGYIDTPLLAGFDDMVKASIVTRIASGRMGQADEIAELVRFLCGSGASYCTGDVFTASGGYPG
jgi:NAD(P)-dependent dehydrogenase (short-subunit alcohol dehydrogenase family)